MSDVQMPRIYDVMNKCRRPPSHIGGKDGRRLAKTNGPPRSSVTGYIAAIRTHLLGDFEKTFNGSSCLNIKSIKVYREIDHLSKPRGAIEHSISLEKLSSFGNRSE
jgi:hypothetical protein